MCMEGVVVWGEERDEGRVVWWEGGGVDEGVGDVGKGGKREGWMGDRWDGKW